MANITDPLVWNQRIVNPNGVATPQFIRQWNSQKLLNTQANAVINVSIVGSVGITVTGTLLAGGPISVFMTSMPTLTIKGNNTGVTAAPLNLTATQVTAMLNTVVGDSGAGGVKGLAPATAAGDNVKFLRGDATWATPSGGGGGGQYMGWQQQSVHNATSFATGFYGCQCIVVDQTTTINNINFVATAATSTSVVTPAIYANSAGALGALLKKGNSVTGVVQGLNTLPLLSGLAVTKGDIIWIGYICQTAAVNAATCTGTGAAFFAIGTSTPPDPASAATYSAQGWASMWCSQ